jgi:hypothetical protein
VLLGNIRLGGFLLEVFKDQLNDLRIFNGGNDVQGSTNAVGAGSAGSAGTVTLI